MQGIGAWPDTLSSVGRPQGLGELHSCVRLGLSQRSRGWHRWDFLEAGVDERVLDDSGRGPRRAARYHGNSSRISGVQQLQVGCHEEAGVPGRRQWTPVSRGPRGEPRSPRSPCSPGGPWLQAGKEGLAAPLTLVGRLPTGFLDCWRGWEGCLGCQGGPTILSEQHGSERSRRFRALQGLCTGANTQVLFLALSLRLGDLDTCHLASISFSFPFCAMEIILVPVSWYLRGLKWNNLHQAFNTVHGTQKSSEKTLDPASFCVSAWSGSSLHLDDTWVCGHYLIVGDL